MGEFLGGAGKVAGVPLLCLPWRLALCIASSSTDTLVRICATACIAKQWTMVMDETHDAECTVQEPASGLLTKHLAWYPIKVAMPALAVTRSHLPQSSQMP